MFKKLLLTSLILAASGCFLAGCILIGPKTTPAETSISGEALPSPTISSTPAPKASGSTEVRDLENDLDKLNLETETFQ